MTSEMEQIMRTATEAYQRDLMFRRHVEYAVQEAMRHFDHIGSDVEHRDLHHAATLAALAVLRLSIEGDALLKGMEVQRDDAMRQLKNALGFAAPTPIIIKRGDGHAGVVVDDVLHTATDASNKPA